MRRKELRDFRKHLRAYEELRFLEPPEPGHHYYLLKRVYRGNRYSTDVVHALLRVTAEVVSEYAERIYLTGPRDTAPSEASLLGGLEWAKPVENVALQGDLPVIERAALVQRLAGWTDRFLLTRRRLSAADEPQDDAAPARGIQRFVMDNWQTVDGVLMLTPAQFTRLQGALDEAGLPRDAFSRVPEAPKRLRDRWEHAGRLASQMNRPLPDDADELIAELVEEYPALPRRGRVGWQRAEARHTRHLGEFAERAASIALRRRDWRYARAGVLAAALYGSRSDWRRPRLGLIVLHEAVKNLGGEPDAFLEESIVGLDENQVEYVRRFLAEPESARGIESVQLVETGTPEGLAWKDAPGLEAFSRLRALSSAMQSQKDVGPFPLHGRSAYEVLVAASEDADVKLQMAGLAGEVVPFLRQQIEIHLQQLEKHDHRREILSRSLGFAIRAFELARRLFPEADDNPSQTDELLNRARSER